MFRTHLCLGLAITGLALCILGGCQSTHDSSFSQSTYIEPYRAIQDPPSHFDPESDEFYHMRSERLNQIEADIETNASVASH